METDNFEYLLSVLEGSRLIAEKQLDFALFMLDLPDTGIAELAATIRANEDSFEMVALNTLSENKRIRIQKEGQFLTFDQLQIKNAMRDVIQ